MNELYERLLKNYKSLEISIQTETMSKDLNDSPYEYEIITIIKDENKMIVYEDMIQIYKQNKFITEQEGETLDEIYELISRQIFDWNIDKKIKKNNEENIISFLAILLSSSIITIISLIRPSFHNGFLKFGIYFLVIFFAFYIVFIFNSFSKKIFIKQKLKKVSKENLDIIEKYYVMKKDWILLCDYDLVMFFEAIDFVCMDFYKMKNKIVQKNLFDNKKIKEIIEKSDEEIKKYYKLGMHAINSIYKYYDETGKRKI